MNNENMKRVMLISSWYDDITERRHKIMAESPYLKEFELSNSNAVPRPHALVTVDELFERIQTDIILNKPDIILMHTGASYMTQPEIFMECFKKLKMRYPNIKFGVEHGRVEEEELLSIGIFDNSDEIKTIEDIFFKIIYGL
jgi:hypothetical protein